MLNDFTTFLLRLVLGRRLPQIRGKIHVGGLEAPITIRRDRFGVPYIRAESEKDAWYGLGFCHAQDRGFQLETTLRLVRGSLSELFGRVMLPVDRLSRRIGFHRAAAGHVAVMPESQLEVLRAYTRGIHAGFTQGTPRRAHGFALLRAQPTPWTETDVMAFMNYMAMHLSPWTAKLTRLFVLQRDGVEALKALDPEYPAEGPVTDPVGGLAGTAMARVLEDASLLLSFIGQGASNNWALAPSHTATCGPILANDPHLAPVIPALWYLAHVSFPGRKICGASFAGMPLIPSGFIGTAAWGVTAGLVDGIDLYVERIDPENHAVDSGNGFEPCRVLRERFYVRGEKKPFEEEVLITPRGPIISDVMPEIEHALSIKATWMKPRPVDGITRWHQATSFESCRENFKHLYLASLNVVYADTSGTIGWQLIGEAPRRKKGWGTTAMPGWDPRFDWEVEHVGLDQMPWLAQPETGFIATANNQPRSSSEGPYLGRDWIVYRQARILQRLMGESDWDLAKTLELQLDQFVLPWTEMKDFVLSVSPSNEMAIRAQALLASWDGVSRAGSPAAAVYEFFVQALAQLLAAAKAPRSKAQVLGKGFSQMFSGTMFYYRHVALIIQLLRERPAFWFDDPWEDVVDRALQTAYRQLVDLLGSDEQAWRWGDVHQLVLRHPLGGRKPFDRIFNRGPYPLGGDHDTVAQAGRSVGVFGSRVGSIANLRMAVEVGNWDQNYFVLAGGQSENPLSPNYDDQLQRWLEGKTIRLAWSDHAVEDVTEAELHLLPAPESDNSGYLS